MPRIRVTRVRARTIVATVIAVGTLGGIGGAALVGGSGDTTPDALAPNLFVTAPANGASISGTVSISATCGDNVGCAGVQFRVNGANFGAEDTTAPFSVSWDTTLTGNGVWPVTAVARDAATNQKVASTISVTVTSGGAPPDVANIFVDSNGGTCTRNAIPAAYVDAAACSSLPVAAAAALCGDLVEVQAGSYGDQVFEAISHSCTPSTTIVFQPASGASVTLGDLGEHGSNYLTFGGSDYTTRTSFTIGILGVAGPGGNGQSVSYVTLRNSTLLRAFLAGSNLTVDHNDLGNYNACTMGGSTDNDGIQTGYAGAGVDGGNYSDHITITRNWIHDIVNTTCSATKHTDGIAPRGNDYLTITRNRFWNIQTGSWMLLAKPETGKMDHVTVENNQFSQGTTGNAGGAIVGDQGGGGQTCRATGGNTIDFNTFVGVSFEAGCTDAASVNTIVRGNIVDQTAFNCAFAGNKWTFTFNAFAASSTNCSAQTGYQSCVPTFANGTTLGDLTLSGSDTCAKGNGDQVNFPALDYDGNTRPVGATVDIGSSDTS